MSKEKIYQGWVVIFTSGTDYEADLVRDRLDDAGMDAVVLTHRDHAFNLNIGDLSGAHVLVPPAQEAEARALLNAEPISDADLEAAALSGNPDAPGSEPGPHEARLDSGIESIDLSTPDA